MILFIFIIQILNSFEILYNFNATKGDFWEIHTKYSNTNLDTVLVNVDSIGVAKINGKILKKLYVTYNYLNLYRIGDTTKYSSVIIQVLGDIDFLINIIDKRFGACDIDFINSLRCYEDSEFGFYNTGLRDSCDYTYVWVSIQQNQTSNDFMVYPNPFENRLMIQIHDNEHLNYELFNLSGVTLKKGHETNLDLSAFQNGIYFLKIIVNNRQVKTVKIIKHLP